MGTSHSCLSPLPHSQQRQLKAGKSHWSYAKLRAINTDRCDWWQTVCGLGQIQFEKNTGQQVAPYSTGQPARWHGSPHLLYRTATVISGQLGKTCDLGKKRKVEVFDISYLYIIRSFRCCYDYDVHPVMKSWENMESIWWRNDCGVFEIGRIIWRDFRRSENNRDCIVWRPP